MSLSEAVRRLRIQESSVAATDRIAAEFSDRLAEKSIEHAPEYRIVVAGGADFVVRDVRPGDFLLLVQIGVTRLHVFLEIERLVLQGMCEFVGQHRLLLLQAQPVQQIYGFGLRIVITRHLFFQQNHQECAQIEVAGQKPKFFQHQFGAAQAFGVFVLRIVLGDVLGHLVAAYQLTLDLMLDGKRCVFAGEAQNLIHRAKEFFRFLW